MRSSDKKKTRIKYQRPQRGYINMCRDLSYNKKRMFILSGKNSGKTTYVKRLIINAFLYKGQISIWVRRQKVEINKLFMRKFFDAYIRQFYPDHIFSWEGGDEGVTFYIDEKPFIYAFAASTMNNNGGNSFDEPVAFFVYDEFMANVRIGQRYLPSEPETIDNAYRSFTRNTNPKYNNTARMIFIGNSVSLTSVFFDYYGIRFNPHNERSTGKNWLVHYDRRDYSNDEVEENEYNKDFANYLKSGAPLITDAIVRKVTGTMPVMILAYRNKQFTISLTNDAFLYVAPWRGEAGEVIGSHLTNSGEFFIDITHLWRTTRWQRISVLIRSNRMIFESRDIVNVREELFRLVSY